MSRKGKKITKEELLKMQRKADRQLWIEAGMNYIRTGPHKTYKDKPRKKKVDTDK